MKETLWNRPHPAADRFLCARKGPRPLPRSSRCFKTLMSNFMPLGVSTTNADHSRTISASIPY